MMEFINRLNSEFESRVRLGIMSILMVNESAEFKSLKELLEVTDGNLASHLTALERVGYIKVKKQFIGRKPNTSYSATNGGKKAFTDHLNHLEKLLKSNK